MLNFKTLLGISMLFTILFSTPSCTSEIATDSEKENPQTSYSITIDSSDVRKAKIVASFELQDSILYMNPGASDLPDRWATFVENLQVFDENNQPVNIEKLPDAQWKVNLPANEWVTLNYTINLKHDEYEWKSGVDGKAYKNDWGVFYTGRSLFIMNGEETEEIAIDFKLPKSWKLTTPWDSNGSNPLSFKVSSGLNLAESMIFAGTHEELILKRSDFELRFAMGGEEILSKIEAYTKMAEGVLDYYIDLFGGTPNPSPQNPFSKAVVIVNPGTQTDGEVIGNNISILIEENGDRMSEYIGKFIFAHEFFHLWNGKSFTPDSEDVEWFREGFTNYYTLKAMHHVNVLDDTTYFDFISNFFFDKYIKDEGLNKVSMSNGAEKHGHWGIIYGGGLMVAICQDISIRMNTDNKNSMDNVMKALFDKYGGTDDVYSTKELTGLMDQYGKMDQSAFLDNYVFGVKEVPIATYLNQLGIDAKVTDKQLHISLERERSELQEACLKGVFGMKKKTN